MFDLFTEPPVAAASIAAVVSLIGLLVSISSRKAQVRLERGMALYSSFVPTQQEVRGELKRLTELLARVSTSVGRLVQLAPRLTDEEMMLETTHTLAIVSDFFNQTSADKLIAFPRDVADSFDEVRRSLTAFFLRLDFHYDSRISQDTQYNLKALSTQLASLVYSTQGSVRRYVAPQLEPAPWAQTA